MPRAFSEDLRKRVVAVRRSGKNAAEVAAMFGVSRQCVYRWDEQERVTGSLAPGYDRVTGRLSKIKVDGKFEAFARAHMHATLKQMADRWEAQVSEMSMSRALKKLGWSRKKRPINTKKRTKKAGRAS
jgi:transposase